MFLADTPHVTDCLIPQISEENFKISKKYLVEDSAMEHTRRENLVLSSEIRNTSNERKDDIIQPIEQTTSPSSGKRQIVGQLDNLTLSKSSEKQEWQEAFSKTNFSNHSTTAIKDDIVDNSQDMHVSNVSDFLNSNDETYEVISLSDNEAIYKARKKPKRVKLRKNRNEKTEVKYGDGVDGYTSSDCVNSNDDTFVDIPISEKETRRRKHLLDDPGKERKTGRKREGLMDLREFIRKKKRKMVVHDSEKHVTSRSHRRRIVDIGRTKTDDPEASFQANSALPDKSPRKITSLNADSELLPEPINVVSENRCGMTSPSLGSPLSTPDRSPAHNETKHKLFPPDSAKRRKSSTPELERSARSPNRREHRKFTKRYAGSSDDSRPGSSPSSRIGNSSSRSANSASVLTPSQVSQRYISRGRSRKERENLNTAREQTHSRSGRQVVEDYPANAARVADEKNSQNFSTGSKHERKRSLSPSGSNYATKRDNSSSKPLSPARESRYRSRYSIKRHNTRSSSNESGKYRRSYDRNNNWSRYDDRRDTDIRTRNQIDLSDETVLSRKCLFTEVV